MPAHWDLSHMPSQDGKIAIVTGGNSGIGFETVRALALKNAQIVIASRNITKTEDARQKILLELPAAKIKTMQLDLASLSSIAAFVSEFKQHFQQLHLLINNAGVMAIPWAQTSDGFEMQFGTNHLGHFALTCRLFDILCATPRPRVVTISSNMHRFAPAHLDLENINDSKHYHKWGAYSGSKLANLLFTYELARRLETQKCPVIAVAAHPGYAATHLHIDRQATKRSAVGESLYSFGAHLFAQSAANGALPTLYAATAPDINNGDYIGPSGFLQRSGYPKKVLPSQKARDEAMARKLWDFSEQCTGLTLNLDLSLIKSPSN